jgi:hypothetical protein
MKTAAKRRSRFSSKYHRLKPTMFLSKRKLPQNGVPVLAQNITG